MNVCKWSIRNSLFRLRWVGLVVALVALFFSAGCSRSPRFRIIIQQTSPFMDSVARQVAARLEPHGYRVEISTGAAASASLTSGMILNVAGPAEGMKPESYAITPIKTEDYWLLRVTGAGPRALLWGALEAADQIVSQGGPEAVRPAKAEPMLSIRGQSLPLPNAGSSVLQQRGGNSEAWRNYFDLLVRSRFNSVFFEIHDDLERFVPRDANSTDAASVDPSEDMERLHAAFRLARERGLSPYAVLEKSALAKWLGKQESPSSGAKTIIAATTGASTSTLIPPSTIPIPGETPPAVRRSLASIVAAFARNYREMEGFAVAPDIAVPLEKRSAWYVENIFSPLAKASEKRPILIGLSGDWWPARASFGDAQTLPPVYLWAPVEKIEEAPAEIPVLWQIQEASDELLPWQDPNTVVEAVQKLRLKKSAGFVKPIRFARADGISDSADVQPPDMEQEWFRVMLWGRSGYSSEIPGNFWEEQFATHFGPEAGRFALAAATHGGRVLALLQSKVVLPGLGLENADGGAGRAFGSGARSIESSSSDSMSLEERMFRPTSGMVQRDLIADALAQKGLLIGEVPGNPGVSPPAEALAYDARQTLTATNAAMQSTPDKDRASQDFFARLENIAHLGLTTRDTLRASWLLAQFAVAGDEKLRQQAIGVLDQAQKSLGSQGSKIPRSIAREAASLGAQIAGMRTLAGNMQPWRWEAMQWEVGTREAWQPASPIDVPVAQATQRVSIETFEEFGAVGRVGWIGAINQRLRTAFFQNPADQKVKVASTAASGTPGSVVVAKTSISAKRDGRLVLRVISDDQPMLWVNRHRAVKITAQQFPWMPAASSTRSIPVQLYSSPIQMGTNEIVAAISMRDKWPVIAVAFVLPADTNNIVNVPLKEAAQFDGGVTYAPATEAAPQAHIGLAEQESGTDGDAITGSPIAVLRFRVRDPGFYRLRLYTYWPSAEKSGLGITLDGTTIKSNAGRNDASYQKWHWVPIDGTFDLGPGEHTLAIEGWKRGAMLGSIEVVPSW